MRGPVSLLVLPVSGQVSNVWEGVGGECMTSPPVADHCSCHVMTDREHSSARTALATFGQRPKMADTGTSGITGKCSNKHTHITLDSVGIDAQKAHQNVVHSMAHTIVRRSTLQETNIYQMHT